MKKFVSSQEVVSSKPALSYEIFAEEGFEKSDRTTVTLMIKAIYFRLDLSPFSADQIKFYSNNSLEYDDRAVYLSRVTYGRIAKFNLSSSLEPARYIPYLKAYLDDILNNDSKNSVELIKKMDTDCSGYEYRGGYFSDYSRMFFNPNKDIKDFITLTSLPRPISSSVAVSFEFKSLKDHTIIK